MSQVVLITGCSSGIGRDLAQHLVHAGYTVVATARAIETLADLSVALKLQMDVTQPKSIQKALDYTMRQFGRIDVLVNNAGFSVFGAAEEISDADLQGMFDVNVFGLMRMIRAVAPIMRAQKSGRIINISSIVGKLVTPANGAYASSKFSVEALSNALRLELEPFGIQVVLVEPGGIKTNFADAAQAKAQTILSNSSSPYQSLYRQFEEVNASMRKGEPGPEVVSQVIQQAIEAHKPKARYLAGVTFSVRLVIGLRDFVWDAVVRQMFKIAPSARQ
jgi:NAD(P)-dependent dehydrogenase (short-subunit alcohol dehydrogenase family)